MGKNKSKIDVIIIDGPECSSQRSRYSQTSLKPNKKFFPRRVIIIDQDDDEFPLHRKGDKNTSESTNTDFQFIIDSDSDESQFMKRTVPVERPTWVFSEDSGSVLTDSDSGTSWDNDSDCEVIDDLSSNIRKEWEKAHMKQKEREYMRSNKGQCEFKCYDEQSLNNTDIGNNKRCRGKAACPDQDDDKYKFQPESKFRSCSSKAGKSSVGISHEIMVEEKKPVLEKQLDLENADKLLNSQYDTIGQRNKHKESEEYRIAQEQEWAARREQIRIQQEEAQRLRKKKKAQTLRLLDMERRQKERIEEIRESQKRIKETTDLKDNLRATIRKELEGLEVKHKDFASLLRALGINIKGGSSPLSSEVNAAFKQALFRFHPDRASKTDIREQVEAEEKFKMISRLRQRWSPMA